MGPGRHHSLERVERRAKHVELRRKAGVCLQDIFPEEVLNSSVGRTVEVDVDLWLRAEIAVSYALGGRRKKLRRVGPVLASSTNRPEDPVGNLVAYVDDGRLDARGLESVAHVERVLVDLSCQTREIRGPTCRDLLLSRVGPGIGKV